MQVRLLVYYFLSSSCVPVFPRWLYQDPWTYTFYRRVRKVSKRVKEQDPSAANVYIYLFWSINWLCLHCRMKLDWQCLLFLEWRPAVFYQDSCLCIASGIMIPLLRTVFYIPFPWCQHVSRTAGLRVCVTHWVVYDLSNRNVIELSS